MMSTSGIMLVQGEGCFAAASAISCANALFIRLNIKLMIVIGFHWQSISIIVL